MPRGGTYPIRGSGDRPRHLQDRSAPLRRPDDAVLPHQTGGGTQCFGYGLFRGEPRGKPCQVITDLRQLVWMEHALPQTRRTRHGLGEPLHADDINADPDYHGHSTVTDFARFRGWSTSCPFTVASAQANTCKGTVETSGCMRVGTTGTRMMSSA